VRIHDSADVDASASIGEGATIWHLAQVRDGATIGAECVVGRGAYVGSGVSIGARSKLQNYALVYEPAVVEEGVFIGPGAVLTNDTYPRAISPQGDLLGADDWHAVGVVLRRGASIGARAVCVAPVEVGEWALVAAGSVVTTDVPAHALVAGAPARIVGWVGTDARRLHEEGDLLVSATTGERYRLRDGALTPVSGEQ
jgi:acetyltransferase-like isoleucine patch superfamily enzyme